MQGVGEQDAGDGTVVGGRYRIDHCIAKGGMGEVYRAFDQTTERAIALKRLRVEGKDRRRERMFEREYHALAGLEHPRIIGVYDYGVDADGPYYTMELLDGSDMRELAPLPHVEACRYLRDVASSLALLHARRLLHRDLSPRNVRITSDGRAKLLDFGALASFGHHTTVVGTPPCVPPEAIHGGMLDQRADLFSLGALAYWLLTGVHAFEVRSLEDLPSAWEREPRAPSRVLAQRFPDRPAIPPQLDHLVLSLLSRNPLARPSSAAEVISLLGATAHLPHDTEPLSAQSYLRGGKTVGRARERAGLRRRLKAAVAGIGSAVVIDTEPGMWTGRIMADLAVEAQLLGATPLVVNAALQTGTYGVVREIVRVLHEQLPTVTRQTITPHIEHLLRFLPTAEGRNSSIRFSALSEEVPQGDPREQRIRTQEALRGWLNDVATRAPLLIAVRNFDRIDDASAALIATLAHGVAQRKLLLVAGYGPDAQGVTTGPLAALREISARMRLKGLTRRELTALVEVTFGQVANTGRLAEWLHELTAGKPQACVDLIHHLVETDVIRFAEGVWSLPQALSRSELPENLDQALADRVSRLDGDAGVLARALSVVRGAVPAARCVALAQRVGVEAPETALDELAWADILDRDESRRSYHFSHGALREAIAAQLGEGERQRLHAEIGALLEQEADDEPTLLLDAGWHLLHGGQEDRGAELLARVGMAMANIGDEIAEVIPALEAALRVMRGQGRSGAELGPILATLAIAGFYSDRRVLEDYGPEAIDVMEAQVGLRAAARMRPWLGRKLSLFAGLGTAWFRLLPRHGPLRAGRELARMITLYSTAVSVTVGLGTLALDSGVARQYLPRLEHLAALGTRTATTVNYLLITAVSRIPEDRVAWVLRRIKGVLEILEDPAPIALLPPETHRLMYGSSLYIQGSLEGFRDSPEALEIADKLEGLGWKLFSLFANQIRANYHAVRGELDRADHFREQVELCAIQAGSGWQADLWSSSGRMLGYRVTGDLIGLKRVIGELDRLADEFPSLRRNAELAKAAYYMEQGDAEKSREHGHALWQGEPRAYIGWASTLAGEVRNTSEIVGVEEAVELGRWALSQYDEEDRQVCAMMTALIAELAIAEGKLGEFDTATGRIEAHLAELGDRGGPATRGMLHLARARIAILEEDLLTARVELAHLDRCYRPTGNPSLIARAEKLRREIAAAEPGMQHDDLLRDTLDLGASDVGHVRTALAQCQSRQQRFETVLGLLVDETRGDSGCLFLWDGQALELVAPEKGQPPPGRLMRRLEREIAQHIERETGQHTEEVVTAATATTRVNSAVSTLEAERYRTFILSVEQCDRMRPLGAVAIAIGNDPLRAPVQAFLCGIAECLVESGDVSTV